MHPDDFILEKIIDIVRNLMDDESIVLTNKSILEEINGWDSLCKINFVVALEKKFKVSFRHEDLGALKSVRSVIELLQSRLSD